MRPALLRLLKRPSALPILDSLAAHPIGIEQLASKYTRLRCHSRCARELTVDDTKGSSAGQDIQKPPQTGGERRPFSFPIYEIEPSDENPSHRADLSGRRDPANSAANSLRLQPERLEFESDIGHSKDIGTRLVDRSEYRNDFELWEELLRFRQRHYGEKGTQDIWTGLTVRLEGVQLPVTGERAEFFWSSFVELGLKRELFLKDLVDYAINNEKSDGGHWPRLYESVVGGLLDRGLTSQAIGWHQKLQHAALAQPSDLARVLQPAIHPACLSANADPPSPFSGQRQSVYSRLKTFRDMCRLTPGHQIYGQVISTLLQNSYGEDAISLHGFLIKRRDHPKTLQEIQPLLEYAKKYGHREEFKRIRAYAKLHFDKDTMPEQKPLEPSDAVLTDTKIAATEGKPFKDDIGARLFATRALNFDMVLGALKMLGVSEIGPRSLREMAIRAHSSQDILGKIKLLRQSDISIGDTVFARLVQKLATQNRDILLSDFLQSDQHPDVLEDVRMQESLLVSYYMARDSRQYNMVLAILAESFPDAPDLLDIHFRKHIAAGELSAASKVVDELTLRGKTLNEDSVDFMAEQVLTPRQMNHRPPLGKGLSANGEVMFIFKILQRVAPAGGYVSAAFWVEMLKRLGMGDYWDELRECCLWLVHQYSHSSSSQSGKPRAVSQSQTMAIAGRDTRMVDLIFTPEMQSAIVAWGFRFRVTSETESKLSCTHPTTGDKLIPWVRGIILLRELEQAGLALQRRAIRKATRARLAMLFGRYCHSARRMNRMLRRRNPYTLHQVLGNITRAWGESSLFLGMELSQPERLVNPPRSPGSMRRSAGVILSRKRAR